MTTRYQLVGLSALAGGLLSVFGACIGDLGPGGGIPGVGGEGAGGGDGLTCTTCPIGGANQGGESSGPGGAGGSGGASDPGPTGPEVCYPGPNNDFTACVAILPWSSNWGSDYAYPSHDSPQYSAPLRFVDLATEDGTLPVAADFTLEEVMQEWKGRYGVFQPHVVARLQTIRELVGAALHINSGYRSPAYNGSVGGVTFSRHMFGDAADMWSEGASVSEIGDICNQLGASYVGLYTNFTHCDWRNEPLEPAFYGLMDWQSSELPQHTAKLARHLNDTSWEAPATGFDEGEPLRVWTAIDSNGQIIARATGATYTPPTGAAVLRVVVGGQVELERLLQD